MSRSANPVRGEATLCLSEQVILLRPSFAALVAAEEELGPLFALVERAAAGQLRLSELVALFWHCRYDAPVDLNREAFAEALTACGLATTTPALKSLLGQILAGQ
ncbi:gene transfer agent family protein [Sphingorhabdus pulchriflava]|uniref:Gene transfer agent family protein n=1 Tax=Sphingorhabdus pulchriflava TaxID=2292257 RepID=A0A371BEQ6_9SPHN|nr:gene transfer agent family protein [Sphingorhabdus pulchriflava]RDV06085.1 gene transfer agent family protein [Sphingorhabdus pulchriflava]